MHAVGECSYLKGETEGLKSVLEDSTSQAIVSPVVLQGRCFSAVREELAGRAKAHRAPELRRGI